MILIVCAGYRDGNDQVVECGKILGEKEGGEGVSHTYCDDCFAKQLEAALQYANIMTLNLKNGTYDFGDLKEVKIVRAQAIGLAKTYYDG